MESTTTNRSSSNQVAEGEETVFTNLDLMCSGFDTSDQNLINELIADLPPGGPLATYRERASFNWKKMKFFLDGEDIIRWRVCIIMSGKKKTNSNSFFKSNGKGKNCLV